MTAVLPHVGHAGAERGIKVLAIGWQRLVADQIERHAIHADPIGKPLVRGNGLLDLGAMHVGFEPGRVEAKLRGDLKRSLLGHAATGADKPVIEREIFALGDCGLRNPRHVL